MTAAVSVAQTLIAWVLYATSYCIDHAKLWLLGPYIRTYIYLDSQRIGLHKVFVVEFIPLFFETVQALPLLGYPVLVPYPID